jgi:hypothetical protein
MPDKGSRRRFDEPIPLPRGRQLVTLEDAGNYITKLPKAKHIAGGHGSPDSGRANAAAFGSGTVSVPLKTPTVPVAQLKSWR